jgi:hypothetical protein
MITVTVVANAEQLGGGELDLCTHMRSKLSRGCRIVFRPTTPPPVHPDIPIPPEIEIGPQFGTAPVEPCDVLFFLANNAIMPEALARTRAAWEQAAAAAKYRFLLLNWQVRDAYLPWFARLWDRAGFLSSTLRNEWCAATGRGVADTCIHPPAVELEPYVTLPARDYSRPVFVRHSAPVKWPPDTLEVLAAIKRGCPDASFEVMGMPESLRAAAKAIAPFGWRQAWAEHRFDFLRRGSVFFYPLRYGYTDQGPRVIVEAMAAGLAVIADNRDGARDRITPETGWLCDRHEDYEAVAREIAADPDILRRKGMAARERAWREFQPMRWMDEVLPMTVSGMTVEHAYRSWRTNPGEILVHRRLDGPALDIEWRGGEIAAVCEEMQQEARTYAFPWDLEWIGRDPIDRVWLVRRKEEAAA